MTPDHLRRIGESLYGERWIAPLARDLRVARKTTQRWLSGYSEIPPGLSRKLHRLLTYRIATLQVLAADLRKRRAA